MTQNILNITDLHVEINGIPIIQGFNLLVNSGEIHAIMGPNGSGKSTLAKVIAGHPAYKIIKGTIYLKNEDITFISPEERSHKGVFLAFQYPVEIPGVNNLDFLRLAYNEKQKNIYKEELDPLSFFDYMNKQVNNMNIDQSFFSRNVNEGFSGGEKKKNEILQMSLLNQDLSILDEADSGLDIDALKKISTNINNFYDSTKAIILITHYQRLLDYIKPHFVHIMQQGQITYTGNAELAHKIEKNGYSNFLSNSNI